MSIAMHSGSQPPVLEISAAHAAGLHDLHLRGGQVGHRVDLAAEQGVHLRGRAAEVGDRDRVEVGLPAAPVVGVALVDALLAGVERLELVGAGADLRGRVRLVADRHHAERVAGQGLRDGRVRRLERQLDRVLVHLLHVLDVHRGRGGVAGEPVGLGPDALERVQDVVRGKRLAVLELDALAQLDRELLGIVLGHALGQAVGGELVVLVEQQQRLEGRHQPGLVGLGDDVLAVHDVLGTAAGDAQPEVPAPLGIPGRAGRAGAGRGRRARPAGHQAASRRQASGADEDLPS